MSAGPVLPTRGGKTRALTKEDFSQQSAILRQPKAQFDELVSLPDSQDRARAIIEAMESIEGDYDNLRGANRGGRSRRHTLVRSRKQLIAGRLIKVR